MLSVKRLTSTVNISAGITLSEKTTGINVKETLVVIVNGGLLEIYCELVSVSE